MKLIQVVTANHINQVNNDPPMNDHMGLTMTEIEETYHILFEGLGNLGPKLHTEVDPEVAPVQIPPRKIPESLKQPLREHLEQLVQQGVIEPVDFPTDRIRAIVVTLNPNGKIKLCLDPRPLNNVLRRCHHPIPTIDDVLPELFNEKVFTKVDCSNGYWQIKLDDDSSNLTTFNTPFGRFKWKPIPFGISPAGEIFQQGLDQAIDGLDGARTVADDI